MSEGSGPVFKRLKVAAFALPLFLLVANVGGVLARPVAATAMHHLSRDDFVALGMLIAMKSARGDQSGVRDLLEALAAESGRLAAAVEAVYSDAFIESAMGDRYGVGDPDVSALLIAYAKRVNEEIREEKRTSRARLRQALLKMVDGRSPEQAEKILGNMTDWARLLQSRISGLSSDELSIIDLQQLVSQRQLALSIVSNLLKALNDATNRIIGNMEGSHKPAGPRFPESVTVSRGDQPCYWGNCS